MLRPLRKRELEGGGVGVGVGVDEGLLDRFRALTGPAGEGGLKPFVLPSRLIFAPPCTSGRSLSTSSLNFYEFKTVDFSFFLAYNETNLTIIFSPKSVYRFFNTYSSLSIKSDDTIKPIVV